MIRQNEVEEIIRLIHNGFDLDLLSFELDISTEQLQEFKKRLETREFAKKSIKSGTISEAICRLESLIENNDTYIVEQLMLLRLKSYADGTNVNEQDIQELEEKRKKLGITSSLDEILKDLGLQIPKRKSSNLKKRKQINTTNSINENEEVIEDDLEELIKPNYEDIIGKYKTEIHTNPQKSQLKRNLLAFAYFRTGKIDEARDELIALIQDTNSFTAYRQLIHIEKSQQNFEDAKLWAYEALDKFPNSIEIREQLISIARAENDEQEIIRQLKDIISIDSENEKNKKRLNSIMSKYER